jgi:hypothetical protein
VRQVGRRAARPEAQWASATIEQVADLRVWVASRMPDDFARDLCDWLMSVPDADPAQELSKRRLALYRRLLDSYGPPRRAAAQVNVDAETTVVRLRLAEIAEADEREDGEERDDASPADDPPTAEARVSLPGSRRFHRA